jgi:hypothetical protein
MTKVLLPLHLALVGLWLGCVLTEALFERALLGKGRDKELILTALHKRVDVFIEIPVFTLVVVTGMLLMPQASIGMVLKAKLVFALLAVATNVFCVHLVFKRHQLAATGDWTGFEATDQLQHKWGAVVLIGILGSGVLGLLQH